VDYLEGQNDTFVSTLAPLPLYRNYATGNQISDSRS